MRYRPQIPQMGQGLGRMNRDRVSQGLSRLNADGTAKGPGVKQAGYVAPPPAMPQPAPMQPPMQYEQGAEQQAYYDGPMQTTEQTYSTGGAWDAKVSDLDARQQAAQLGQQSLQNAYGQQQGQSQPMPMGGMPGGQFMPPQQKAQYATQAMDSLGSAQQQLGQQQSAMGRYQMPFRQEPRRY